MTLTECLKVFPQYILPHHLLSRCMSRLTHSRQVWLKNRLIRAVIRCYGVDMQEAADQDINAYPSFNAFFTRALKAGIRPVDTDVKAIVSPADGVISQAGRIADGRILQAKGHDYTVQALLGGDAALADTFKNGSFATLYLSPRDYHRLHMPLAGTLTEMLHVPGRLFSVNNTTAAAVPGLFARNERVVCLFDTAAGPMALVLVGAIFVSSIETVWHGVVTPPSRNGVRRWQYPAGELALDKADEMGRFNMGSTIIVLFGRDAATWHADVQAGKALKVGQSLGRTV